MQSISLTKEKIKNLKRILTNIRRITRADIDFFARSINGCELEVDNLNSFIDDNFIYYPSTKEDKKTFQIINKKIEAIEKQLLQNNKTYIDSLSKNFNVGFQKY